MSENTALLTEEPINDTVKELVEKWENVEGNLFMAFRSITGMSQEMWQSMSRKL